jgi:ribosomal protein S27AE
MKRFLCWLFGHKEYRLVDWWGQTIQMSNDNCPRCGVKLK